VPSLETLLRAARAHGDASEPDHEIGDLQDLVRRCWEVMAPFQRQQVFNEAADLLDWLKGEID
jgi:hypothetical protein